MIDAFVRIGPLMDPASYPQWAQQLIRDCSESKRRAVKHEIYKRMRDNTLSPRAMLLAAAAMLALRCLHPPGGAVALTAVLGSPGIQLLGYGFVFWP